MEELSNRLYSACDRMHDEVTKFYEAVHPDGKPIENERHPSHSRTKRKLGRKSSEHNEFYQM